ncbi:MAG: hypothetical protein KGQ41_09810 [Alphaproteobacteria bacterium]|nr:hypothetical protein [Alphaproteobacteria bacterium]
MLPHPEKPEDIGPYTLMRIDTHGNKFPIVAGVSEAFAKAAIAKLTENVHKQHYWYEIPQKPQQP